MERAPAARLLELWEAGRNEAPLRRAVEMLRKAGGGDAPGDPATLPLGVRDLRLLELREEMFGPEVEGISQCPECGEAVEMHFTVDQIRLPRMQPRESMTVEAMGYRVRFRLPTSLDLMGLESGSDVEANGQHLLQRCVTEAVDERGPVSPGELPPAVVEAVTESMAENDPQAQVELSLECPACGRGWREIFDIESFFWNELQPQAKRLLQEIHQLASAYGWSERAILALPAMRRSVYLNLIAE